MRKGSSKDSILRRPESPGADPKVDRIGRDGQGLLGARDPGGRLGNPSETFTGGNERPRFVAMDRADGLSGVAEEDAGDSAAKGMEVGSQTR